MLVRFITRRAVLFVVAATSALAMTSGAPSASATAARPAAAAKGDYGTLSAATYLSCTGKAKISGSFSLKVQNLKATGLHTWTTQDKGKQFSGSLSWQTVVSASITVDAKTVCTPGKALKKLAAKWVVAGVVITVRPDFSLTISADAAITATQTTTETIGISGTLGLHVPKVTHTDDPQPPVVTASGKATFDALIGADATITAGIVSLDFDILGGLHVTATLNNAQICADGYPEIYLTGTLSVQVWGWHPSLTFLKLKPNPYPIKSIAGHSTHFHLCTAQPTPQGRYVGSILSDQPDAFYQLGDTGQTTADSSGHGYAGSYATSGLTHGVGGPMSGGLAVTADGTEVGAVATSAAIPVAGSSFTLEGWWRSTSANRQMLVAVGSASGQGSAFGLGFWPSDNLPQNASQGCTTDCLKIDMYQGGVDFQVGNLDDGKWHLLDVTFDSASKAIDGYVDGKSVGTSPEPFPVTVNSGQLMIGGWVDTIFNQPFDGSIADVAVYPTALSGLAVATHFAASKS